VELSEVIRERRSIRKFKEDEIPSEILEKVMEAIRWAPSWANTQCWDVVIVRGRDQKRKLAETLPRGNPALGAMTDAPVVLAVCAKKGLSGFYKGEESTDKGDWYMFDTGLAVQNLCLTAHSLGLGTVIVGLFNAKAAEAVLKTPQDRAVVVLIPLGFPAKQANAPRRKEPIEFVRYESFQ
jgi:nitroreductase